MLTRAVGLLVLFCAITTASAKPRRIVVLTFEGESKTANAGQQLVTQALDSEYDLVSEARWIDAKLAAAGRGPLQWSSAAKATDVQAVIDGWIDPTAHAMIVAVSDAMTGRQIDTVSVAISDQGVVGNGELVKLTKELEDLLAWVDDEASATTGSAPPAHLAASDVDSTYPSDEPVIETRRGGTTRTEETAVVWADGTVQLAGQTCVLRKKLTPARVTKLIAALDRAGIFGFSSADPFACMDGTQLEVDVRENDRRVLARGAWCGAGDRSLVTAYDQISATLGPNPCN